MKDIAINKWLGYKNGYIILLWVILTIININKAYHIDDTFHLEAAECIKQHPFKPMSGYINWGNSPTPMYEHNQPPLFFYIIYLYQSVFGVSEVSMHLLLSVFTFLSLYYFSKLSLLLNITQKSTILTIFAFCPAFVVNQNLMTDVPILAITQGIIYYLLKGQKEGALKYYLISAMLLSAGLLIKYSLLPVMFVFALSVILSKDYKKSLVLLIPFTVLLLWSIWNLIEFDSVHIFDRPRSSIRIDKLWPCMGALGSMSMFSMAYIYGFFPKKITRYFVFSIFFLFFLSAPLVYFGFIDEAGFNQVLNYLFISNGLILIALILYRIIESLIRERADYLKTPVFTLALYILVVTTFITLYAPFSATRHVLLIIPFILLFGYKEFEISTGAINNLILTGTIILGILLGISDWVYADFYRKSAKEIKITESTVWSIGHWGWQWYSKKAGMKIYAQENELKVRNGDIIVYPKDISKQEISTDIKLEPISYITQPPNLFTFFSGKDFASMYNSSLDKPAWSLSNAPIDTILVCKVIKEISVEDIINRIRVDENRLDTITKKAVDKGVSLDSMLVLDATEFVFQKRNE